MDTYAGKQASCQQLHKEASGEQQAAEEILQTQRATKEQTENALI